MLKINDISIAFDKKEVLNGVDWQLEEGKVYGLVGPNGSGKSTLLRIISGVLKPDHGDVILNDQNVYNNPNIKGTISFVSDDFYFLNGSSLNEMKAFYKSFYPDFSESVYHNLLDIFPINEKEKISAFSKGMKRQASLILCLATGPKLLLLDEAFDGLDPVMRLSLKRYISDQMIDSQLTVIVSSHNLRELEDICDSIALIDHRKVVLNESIDNYRLQYHKFQLGFSESIDKSIFDDFKPLKVDGNGKVYTLVLKGDKDSLCEELSLLNPIILETLSLSLEELFVYEMEERGYGKSA